MSQHRSRTISRLSNRLSQHTTTGVLGGAAILATGLTLASIAGADSDPDAGHGADYTVAASTDDPADSGESTDSAAPADPARTGPVVAFGDSYFSAPSVPEGLGPCGRSTGNWTRLAAAETGRDIHDYSCAGDTSTTMLDRVDEAVKAGDLDAGTATVVLAIGGNDFSHQKAVLGDTVGDLPETRGKVLGNIAEAVSRIRAAAPDARLVFTGYLPSTDGPKVCRDAGTSVDDEPLNDLEAYISGTMARAAEAAGASFVDVRDAAAGNSTCSPVGTRYVSGSDDGSSDVLLKWHPTQAGNRFMADLLIPEL